MRVLVDYSHPEHDMYEWELAVHEIPDSVQPMEEYDGPAGIKMKIYDRDTVPEIVWSKVKITIASSEEKCLELFKELPEEQRDSIVKYACDRFDIDKVGYEVLMWVMILTAVEMWKCDAVWYIFE